MDGNSVDVSLIVLLLDEEVAHYPILPFVKDIYVPFSVVPLINP